MINTVRTTIDGAGRLVVPKPIREQAGISPGDVLNVAYRDGRIEIEPAPRDVHITESAGFRIAEPSGPYETLTQATVRRTLDDLHEARKDPKPRKK